MQEFRSPLGESFARPRRDSACRMCDNLPHLAYLHLPTASPAMHRSASEAETPALFEGCDSGEAGISPQHRRHLVTNPKCWF